MDIKTQKAIEMLKHGITISDISSTLRTSTSTISGKLKRELGQYEYRKIVERNMRASRQRNAKILHKEHGQWSPIAEKDALDKHWEATKHLAGRFYLGFFARGLEQ
jgi:IS30 family transposase